MLPPLLRVEEHGAVPGPPRGASASPARSFQVVSRYVPPIVFMHRALSQAASAAFAFAFSSPWNRSSFAYQFRISRSARVCRASVSAITNASLPSAAKISRSISGSRVSRAIRSISAWSCSP